MERDGAAVQLPAPAPAPQTDAHLVALLPEPLLLDVLGYVALPDALQLASCCRALHAAVVSLLKLIRAHGRALCLPVAMPLAQFAKPALTRTLLAPARDYMAPQRGPCRWNDLSYVAIYVGAVLLGGVTLDEDLRQFAGVRPRPPSVAATPMPADVGGVVPSSSSAAPSSGN